MHTKKYSPFMSFARSLLKLNEVYLRIVE